MNPLSLIKAGIVPSGNKNGTLKERMHYWHKIAQRSDNPRAWAKFDALRAEWMKSRGYN
jgi:hypothetical protein